MQTTIGAIGDSTVSREPARAASTGSGAVAGTRVARRLRLDPIVADEHESIAGGGKTTSEFANSPLPPATIDNLQRLGYTRMTPIPVASLPPV